jgi:hypothetical protein
LPTRRQPEVEVEEEEVEDLREILRQNFDLQERAWQY